MKLSQRQIDLFNAIMIHKSMTAAAVALGTSQPTISREIREMEHRLGFELFLRFGKRLTPTDQAELLHEAVRRSFIGLDEIGRAASVIRTHNAANFRIASIPAHAESILPKAIQRFRNVRPAVHFSIHSHEEPSLRHDMATQVIDLSLTETQFEREGTTTDTIQTGNMVCALTPSHPLSARRVLEPVDFDGQPFIYFGQNDPYRHKLDEVFLSANVSRHYAAETTTAASVCAMVAAGIGISVINPLTAANHSGANVVFRQFSVGVPYFLSIWRPARSTRAAQAAKFVATLRDIVEEMAAALQVTLEPSGDHFGQE